jgi:hypothetical protein
MSAINRTVTRACPHCGARTEVRYDRNGQSVRHDPDGRPHDQTCTQPRDTHQRVGGRALQTK